MENIGKDKWDFKPGKKMDLNHKIIIWCGMGSNQKALANKLHTAVGVSGIVIEKRKTANKRKLSDFVSKALDFIYFRKIHNAWRGMQEYYDNNFPGWPDVPVFYSDSINSNEVFEFTSQNNPDLIVVSGTSLVKGQMLKVPVRIGIVNLHTGLSPFIKGGPNCTNWCIANNEWHMIGNTIMWINEGIDSGNIITTEAIDIRNQDSLLQAHIKVMESAHDLYLRAIKYLINNQPPYISVAQSELGKGKLFLNKMWNNDKKRMLLRNWRKRKKVTLKPIPETISLPGK